MRDRVVSAALVAALAVAAPAMAAQQLVSFTGTAGVSPSGTPIAALQQFAGATVVGAFLVDTAAAGQQLTGPVGGQGEGALLTGAIIGGQIDLFGSNGPVTLLRTGNDFGNIFTVNNGGTGPAFPNNRIDQMGYSTGARLLPGQLLKPYDSVGSLPPDLFIASLFFGRTLQGTVASPPALITDVTTRDFGAVLTGPLGSPLFMNIVFRQGDPLVGGSFAGLPLQAVGVGNFQLSIINIGGVPEPSSWALLIIGFGLTGVTLRRRRAVAA